MADPIERTDPPLTLAGYASRAREIEAAEPDPKQVSIRVGLLGSFTLEFLRPFLIVEGARRGFRIQPWFGPYGQLEQPVTEPTSPLYAFGPQALVILARPEDFDPDLFPRFYAEGRGAGGFPPIVDRIVTCARRFRERSPAPILVANFALPSSLPLGPFDANDPRSPTYAVAAANAELRDRVREIPDAAIWDYAGVVRSQGAASWTDPRMAAIARTPIASRHLPALAAHLTRSLGAFVRPPAKCLVLDLDNTVWGGVIGDDGLEGIKLGDDFPGSAFKALQRAALGLADRGILLAVVSKNDREVAEEAIRKHPEMLLRMEHLSAFRINWEPKSRNLREIARELNIGSDALVLFDDNPAERGEVAANAPEVRLIDVPADPLLYVQALDESGFFDTTSVSQEDRQRVQMYLQDRAREQVKESSGSAEGFLQELRMEAEIGPVDKGTLGRVAQLVAKTNQFNLTTRRHSQAVIAEMCSDERLAPVYLRLRDRFGDLGLIAVGILTFDGGDAIIDSFVMSCRAMGRQAEVALAAELARRARAAGARRLIGEYIPTKRNGIVADLYLQLGFSPLDATDEGTRRFVLPLDESSLEWPALIARTKEPHATVTPA